LNGVLSCSWTAVPSGEHRLVPDGCIDVLWTSSDALVICGPETTAWTFQLPAGTTAVGVRFRPGVAPAVFDFDASEIFDRRVPLESIIGGERDGTIRDRLRSYEDFDECRRALEAVVVELVDGRTLDTHFSDRVIDRVVSESNPTATDLADHVGLTVRQLHRRSLRSFGYGPKVLGRLLRFQRFLALSEASRESNSLTALGADAGYSDHPHLVRDCRAITGLTPTAFLDEYFPTFPEMSDPFKTATPLIATMPT